MLGLLPGCSHHPVYPEYGTALVTSYPPRAEIDIDGERTHRATPCKFDGVNVGTHSIKLRTYNYRIERRSFTIKPAQTTHLSFHLQQITVRTVSSLSAGGPDLACDPINRRLYIATWGTQCLVCGISDTLVTPLGVIELNASPRLIAVSPAAGRLFCLLSDDSLALVDLNSLVVIRRIGLPGMSGYRSLDVSPDGSVVMASDSINQQLVLLDARLGSVTKCISLAAGPSDAVFGPAGTSAYVILPQTREMMEVGIASGAVQFSIATGNDPGKLFWNPDYTILGCCNQSDISITLCDVAHHSAVTTRLMVGGTSITGACFTTEPEYLFFIVNEMLCHCYIPEWEVVGPDVSYVGKIIRSSTNQKYYYALNGDNLLVLAGDF